MQHAPRRIQAFCATACVCTNLRSPRSFDRKLSKRPAWSQLLVRHCLLNDVWAACHQIDPFFLLTTDTLTWQGPCRRSKQTLGDKAQGTLQSSRAPPRRHRCSSGESAGDGQHCRQQGDGQLCKRGGEWQHCGGQCRGMDGFRCSAAAQNAARGAQPAPQSATGLPLGGQS